MNDTTYDLIFEGLNDTDEESLRAFKILCISELELSSDDVQRLLEAPPAIICSAPDEDSLNDRFVSLVMVGARVQIVKHGAPIPTAQTPAPESSSTGAVEPFEGLSLDDPVWSGAPPASAPELDADSRLFPNLPPTVEATSRSESPSAAPLSGFLELSLDDEPIVPAEKIPAPAALTAPPAPPKPTPTESIFSLDLAPEPETVPLIDSLTGEDVDSTDELLSSMRIGTHEKDDSDSEALTVAPEEPAPSPTPPAGPLDVPPSAPIALSLDGFEEEPPQAPQTVLPKPTVDSSAAAGLQTEGSGTAAEPPPSEVSHGLPAAPLEPVGPLASLRGRKKDPSLAEEIAAEGKRARSEVGEPEDNSEPSSGEGLKLWHLAILFVAGAGLLVWLNLPDPEAVPLPSPANLEERLSKAMEKPPPPVGQKRPAPTVAPTEAPPKELFAYAGSRSGSEITTTLTFTGDAESLAKGTVQLSTTEPPPLTDEEIVRNVERRPWIVRVEFDPIALVKSADSNSLEGAGSARVYVEYRKKRQRIIAAYRMKAVPSEGEAFDLSYALSSGELPEQDAERVELSADVDGAITFTVAQQVRVERGEVVKPATETPAPSATP